MLDPRSGVTGWLVLAAAIVSGGCVSSSGGGGTSDAGYDFGDGGTGSGVTFACTVDTSLCTQIVAPASAMSGEQQACTMQMGVFSTGPCPTAGAVGCCVNGIEEQCAYTASEASILQMTCTGSKTWTGSDAGLTHAEMFIGTWARSGTQTVTCGTAAPTTSMLTGDLTITAGSNPASIVATAPDGCATSYTVVGMVATATPGESCNVTGEAGVAETVSVVMHTLTLSADGTTITSVGSSDIDKTATMTMCTATSMGTFTKM
jgi:hypothetical protein